MFIPRQLNKSLNAKDRNRNDKQKNYRGTENDKYLSFFNILFHVCKQDGRLLGLWPGSHYSQKPKLAHAKTSKNLKPQTEVPKI